MDDEKVRVTVVQAIIIVIAKLETIMFNFLKNLWHWMCLASRKCNKRQKINAAPGMGLLFNFGMLQPVAFAAEN